MHVDQSLTDVQILDCQVHQNAFGGRAPPGPARGAIALPRPTPAFRGRGVREGEGKGCK